MSLDRRPSDAELTARMLRDPRGRMLNGIELGPDSPVLPAPAPRLAPRREKFALTEHDIQAAAFEKINDVAEQLRRPGLARVFAVPNGGMRSKRTAAKLKAEGVKPGVLDIWCPVARGGFLGCVIEVKTPTGSLRPGQPEWLAAMMAEGWRAVVHDTSDGIWYELTAYLDQPRTVVVPSCAK